MTECALPLSHIITALPSNEDTLIEYNIQYVSHNQSCYCTQDRLQTKAELWILQQLIVT